jgi:enolase
MTGRITNVNAVYILDARGNPTLRVEINLGSGHCVSESVPSGASTGENETVETGDGGTRRYGRKRVLRAIKHIENDIDSVIIARSPAAAAEAVRLLTDFDGTPNKSRLGANAILGASMAAVRAATQIQ